MDFKKGKKEKQRKEARGKNFEAAAGGHSEPGTGGPRRDTMSQAWQKQAVCQPQQQDQQDGRKFKVSKEAELVSVLYLLLQDEDMYRRTPPSRRIEALEKFFDLTSRECPSCVDAELAAVQVRVVQQREDQSSRSQGVEGSKD